MRSLGILLTAALACAAVTPAVRADPRPARAELRQARVDAAAKAFAETEAAWRAGRAPLDDVYLWSTRWLGAQRDQPVRGKALATALADHLARMRALAAEVDRRVNAGTEAASARAAADYYVAEATVWAADKR